MSEKSRQKTDIESVKLYRADLDRINALPDEQKTIVLNAILQTYDDYAPRYNFRDEMPDITKPPYSIPPELHRFASRLIGNAIQDIQDYWTKCDQNSRNRNAR